MELPTAGPGLVGQPEVLTAHTPSSGKDSLVAPLGLSDLLRTLAI